MEVLGDAMDSPGGDPKPLSNDVLWIKGRLGEDVLFDGSWDVIPVPHERWRRKGKGDRDNRWHKERWSDGRRASESLFYFRSFRFC